MNQFSALLFFAASAAMFGMFQHAVANGMPGFEAFSLVLGLLMFGAGVRSLARTDR